MSEPGRTVDLGRVLERTAARRNAAFDEADRAMAAVDELLAENAELRAEVERLRGSSTPDA